MSKDEKNKQQDEYNSLQNTLIMESQQNVNDKLYLLSLDGGGVRGIIQLFFLVTLEQLTGKSCDEIFYFIGGCSIGGIITLGLRAEDQSLNPETSLYEMLQLNELFTKNKKFSQIQKNTLITTAYLDKNRVVPVCFAKFQKSAQGRNQSGQFVQTLYEIKSQLNQFDQPVKFEEIEQGFQYQDAPLWQIASSTSAAYPYFNKYQFEFENNPYQNRQFIDGGYLFNNLDLLLIEFLKQIDNSYNQTNKLSQFVLISLDNSGSQVSSQPAYQQNEIDEELSLPTNIFSIYLKSEQIEQKSKKNQGQSIFLTQKQQSEQLFTYMRLSVPKFDEIKLDDTQFETLDNLQLIGHQFIQNTDWQQISDILGKFQFIPKEISVIENLERDYEKDYEYLNKELDEIIIDNFTNQFQSFNEFYKKEGKQIEEKLTKIIYNFKIRNNKVNVIKMNDPSNNIIEKSLDTFVSLFRGKKQQFLGQKFKGVLQLAAGIESNKTIQFILTLLHQFKVDYKKFLTDQIGANQWNPLVAASANGRLRSFIFLIQYLHDLEVKDTENYINDYCIYQIQEDNKKKFNHMMQFKQYNFFKIQHQSILDIAPEKFKKLIEWWII